MAETKRERYTKLLSTLDAERSTHVGVWRDLADYILPRRTRFLTTDRNKGDNRYTKIIDNTATLAARTLKSGMMAGMTSPARPWFRLTTPDPDLAEFGPVKEWLHFVGQRMATLFLRSNLYNALPIIYGDEGVFGTAACAMLEDDRDILRFYPFNVGSYWLACNHRMQVDTFMREFPLTVRQVVTRFATFDEKTGAPRWDNFSTNVRNLWDRGDYEQTVDVMHVIAPNLQYRPALDRGDGIIAAKHKRFASCYYEKASDKPDVFLSESGFDENPILAPRWDVEAEGVYGTDFPGIQARGDIRALQLMHKRKAEAIEKMVRPPMTGPSSLRNAKASILPGDITYLDVREGQQGFRPAHEVNARLDHLVADIGDHRDRIRRAFYEDLFLMLAMSDRRQITAREIEERHEEKLLALGPTLERQNDELLDPLIDRGFNIMLRRGLVPEPPREIQGEHLRVEYISIMAQAQKLVGLAGIERFAGFVGQVAQVDPQVLDKIDRDQMVDEYADITGVPPRIVVPDDKVAEIRAVRAKAQKDAADLAALEQAARAGKTLADTNTGGKNMLTDLVSGVADSGIAGAPA